MEIFLLTFLKNFRGNISVKVRDYCGCILYSKCFAVITLFFKTNLIVNYHAKHEQKTQQNTMR
jgi:hypothetical protein